MDREKYRELRGLSRDMRDNLTEAFSSDDLEQIKKHIDSVLQYENDERFKGTSAARNISNWHVNFRRPQVK